MPEVAERRRMLAWLGQRHRVRSAFGSHFVPCFLRQCDLVMPVWGLGDAAAQQARVADAIRRRDRGFFGALYRLEWLFDLEPAQLTRRRWVATLAFICQMTFWPFRSIVVSLIAEPHMIHDIELPQEIKITVATALHEVAVHPKHFLHPKTRRALYDLIQSLLPTTAQQMRGWTAFITARRVLPIFEHSLPDEYMPRRLLTLAQRILVGSLSPKSWRVKRYVDISYHAAGHSWGRNEEEVPYSADVAGYAARKAILEVLGYEPLRNLHYLYVFTDQQRLSGDNLSDLHLASDETGDTASAAAIAYATEGDDPKEVPNRLQRFWEWWLQDAVTQGWKQTHSKSLPPNKAL